MFQERSVISIVSEAIWGMSGLGTTDMFFCRCIFSAQIYTLWCLFFSQVKDGLLLCWSQKPSEGVFRSIAHRPVWLDGNALASINPNPQALDIAKYLYPNTFFKRLKRYRKNEHPQNFILWSEITNVNCSEWGRIWNLFALSRFVVSACIFSILKFTCSK